MSALVVGAVVTLVVLVANLGVLRGLTGCAAFGHLLGIGFVHPRTLAPLGVARSLLLGRWQVVSPLMPWAIEALGDDLEDRGAVHVPKSAVAR